MRITHRMIADTVNYNLQGSLRRLERYSNQLSTGKLFSRPSENPVGVGRVMSYSMSISRNEQFRLNMNQSRGWLDNTEYSLQNGLDVLQRIRELCVYGANESLTAEDRRAIAPEVLEFIDHLIGVANTEVNGLYIFGGHQTLNAPFIREKLYRVDVGEGGGILMDDDNPVSAEGLMNGSYRLEQDRQTTLSDQDGAFEIIQHYLQGSAESIFVRSVGENSDIQVAASGSYSTSVLLEVKDVDNESLSAGYGTISYAYRVHRYDLDGAYSGSQGEFTLRAGGPAEQVVDLHGVELTFSGLDQVDPALAVGLKSGDRAVLNIQPTLENGSSYDLVRINGDHREISGENGMFKSGAHYTFREGALDDRRVDFRYYSLDGYYRSPERGTVYDGKISVSYEEFLPASGSAVTFSYDRNGFPVYHGDRYDRIQEISPFQELIMNLSGDKAFGPEQEVFEAVFQVFWALADNDRETLGGEALRLMDGAVDHFLEKLAQVGARSNRLEAMHNTLANQNLYLREVRSNIEDIDLAEKVTEFMMQENAYRAALSTAAMMLQPSLVDYWR